MLVSLIFITISLLSRLSRELSPARHYYDGTAQEDVTDGWRLAGGAIRSESGAASGGGVPDARLGQRGRRRRAGSLAAAQPRRYDRSREPQRLADDRGRPRLSGHAALAQIASRGVADAGGRAAAGRGRPGARSSAGGVRRLSAAGRASTPDAGRARG